MYRITNLHVRKSEKILPEYFQSVVCNLWLGRRVRRQLVYPEEWRVIQCWQKLTDSPRPIRFVIGSIRWRVGFLNIIQRVWGKNGSLEIQRAGKVNNFVAWLKLGRDIVSTSQSLARVIFCSLPSAVKARAVEAVFVHCSYVCLRMWENQSSRVRLTAWPRESNARSSSSARALLGVFTLPHRSIFFLTNNWAKVPWKVYDASLSWILEICSNGNETS